MFPPPFFKKDICTVCMWGKGLEYSNLHGVRSYWEICLVCKGRFSEGGGGGRGRGVGRGG